MTGANASQTINVRIVDGIGCHGNVHSYVIIDLVYPVVLQTASSCGLNGT